MQGNGKSDIGDGLIYEGHFSDYMPDGTGSLYQDGNLIYAGKWDNGFPADKEIGLFSGNNDVGTQNPGSGGFGPKLKDYGDQKGINIAVSILTALACAAGSGACRNSGPRSLPR